MGGAFSSTTTTTTTTSIPAASDPTTVGSETPTTDSGTSEDQTLKEASESSSTVNAPEESDQLNNPSEEDGEKEGECGFCLFMKGGPCREVFVEWEYCVEAEHDDNLLMEKCINVNQNLRKCIEENPDYYAAVLLATESVEEKDANAGSKESESNLPEKEIEETVEDKAANAGTNESESNVPEGSSSK